MKIKIICRKEKYMEYKSILEKAGFIIDDDALLEFRESDYKPDHFIGKKEGHIKVIMYEEVIMIESFGREISLYTKNDTYQIKQRLYEIELGYEEFGFIRINKSQVVNKSQILKIKPLFNARIKLILSDQKVVEVSRNYQEKFKEFIGF